MVERWSLIKCKERHPFRDSQPMASHSGAFSLVALCLLLEVVLRGAAETLVPAVFVFGDSMVDIGNNNFIEKCDIGCKANYPPFGIDYLNHTPTVRFSNGYNLADQLGTYLHGMYTQN